MAKTVLALKELREFEAELEQRVSIIKSTPEKRDGLVDATNRYIPLAVLFADVPASHRSTLIDYLTDYFGSKLAEVA